MRWSLQGSFGIVREGFDELQGGLVAVKLENGNKRHAQLRYEFELYRYINGQHSLVDALCPPVRWKDYSILDEANAILVDEAPKIVGFPAVRWYGGYGGHRVLVMDLLGPSLEEVHRWCGFRFSLHTVLMIGVQMISRVEAVHLRGVLHRDIKPQNFCLGHGATADVVYLIDMGLSKPYLVSDGATTHSHIPCVRGKKLAGTARYASISTHLGFEQGRRDDLESIAYVLQYLLNGSLPWKGIHASSKLQKYKLIGDKKQACKLSDLCEGFPELETYIQYCRTLGFTEMPDYEYIKVCSSRKI